MHTSINCAGPSGVTVPTVFIVSYGNGYLGYWDSDIYLKCLCTISYINSNLAEACLGAFGYVAGR